MLVPVYFGSTTFDLVAFLVDLFFDVIRGLQKVLRKLYARDSCLVMFVMLLEWNVPIIKDLGRDI